MKIVMVHGIWDTGRIYRRMQARLSQEGHTCFAPDLLPANAANGLRELSEQLKDLIDQEFDSEEPIAVVGFSMGTLIARNYIQQLGGHQRTTHYFAISGPHRGTLAAHFWPGKAARDMRFRSQFIERLNDDLSPFEKIEVHSYRTPFDLLVVPSRTSHLPWAKNHTLPAAFHHRMVVQPKLIEHIAETLNVR